MTKYVIIGGSAGGIGAVEAIREVDPYGNVDSNFGRNSSPVFPSHDLRIRQQRSHIGYYEVPRRPVLEKHNVQALTGRTATKIDFTKKQVELDGGDKMDYEKLLIATGGKPFVPRMEGGEKDGVFTFTELSSAEGIEAKLEQSKSAVVIGGGLIGVSASEALVKRGIKVTLVELKENILNLILDKTASEIAEKVLTEAGVTVITGQSVQRILGQKDNQSAVGGVVMTDGTEIPCDLVVVAIGVIPRTELRQRNTRESEQGNSCGPVHAHQHT